MVAIKIQSLDDIIEAYLCGLGFEKKDLKKASELMLEALGTSYNADNVLASLDALLLKTAVNVFPGNNWEQGQQLAMFKLVFLLSKAAQKWGAQALLAGKISEEMKKTFQAQMMCAAPQYHLSHMQPQKIESAGTAGFIKNLFCKLKKD